MSLQHTLKAPAVFTGVGLHSGQITRLWVLPAAAGSGIVFRRVDRGTGASARVAPERIVDTRLSTVLELSDGSRVGTIEHLMSALAGRAIDNALILLDGPEVPVLDGSSVEFLNAFDRVGLRAQNEARRWLRVLRPVTVSDGDKWVRLAPGDGQRYEMRIDFAHPAIRRMPGRVRFDADAGDYAREVADCRTFGFIEDIETLRRHGLARGGSLDNAVVVDEQGVMNPEGLRRPDELVRHKLLDAIGDLYVLGLPIRGIFTGYKSGHELNNRLLRELLARPDSWEITEGRTIERRAA